MKAQIALCAVVLIGCCMLSATAQAEQTAAANEVRQVKFAERVITIELVRALSLSVRKTREKCLMACPETEALELAVGLIGISRSDVASDALVNLCGFRGTKLPNSYSGRCAVSSSGAFADGASC
jgi:hypothetical protein